MNSATAAAADPEKQKPVLVISQIPDPAIRPAIPPIKKYKENLLLQHFFVDLYS